MATSGPTNLPSFFNTDADFRSYCQGIHDALVACGLVVTSDTGQINLTTVAKPSAINTAQGYEIYKFNDTLQASKPIYIKIEYGSGGAVDRPAHWITVGTGTNGAGTISGNASTRTQVAQGNSMAAGNTLPVYASGAQSTTTDARIALFASVDATSGSRAHGFHIERTNDANGNPTSDGFYVFLWGPSNPVYVNTIPHTGTIPSNASYAQSINMGSNQGGSSSFGGNAAVSPIYGQLGLLSPQKLLAYKPADLTGIATATVAMFGANHTVMVMDAAMASNNLEHGSIASQNVPQRVAMFWE